LILFSSAICPGDHVSVLVPLPVEVEIVATNGDPFPWDDIRLPKFIIPIRYDIELTPNLTTGWVKGIEKLIFRVTEETNFIVFHSKNITITSRTINERLNVERMLEFPHREQIYLETDDVMLPDKNYAVRGAIHQLLSIILKLRILVSLPGSNLPYVVKVKNHPLIGE
jgi:hypothetical protein